jgi:predicted GIY-YIG superfamily endonuclease
VTATESRTRAGQAFSYLEHLGPHRPEMIVYLYHLDPPYKHAAHYMGSTDDFDRRDAEHGGPHGARLLQVQKEAGGTWHLVRTWAGGRQKENELKSNAGKRYCPECTKHPLPGIHTVPRKRKTRHQRAQEQQRRYFPESQQQQPMPLWLTERTAVPVTEEQTLQDAALADVISALETEWCQQAPTGLCGYQVAGGYR